MCGHGWSADEIGALGIAVNFAAMRARAALSGAPFPGCRRASERQATFPTPAVTVAIDPGSPDPVGRPRPDRAQGGTGMHRDQLDLHDQPRSIDGDGEPSPRRLSRADLHAIDGASRRRDLASEWRHAWAFIHGGVEAALKSLPLDHPQRADLLHLLRDAADCAELPSPSELRSAAPA